ncbi:MAG TPA: hypothetical protein ENK23_08460, partial [Sorangium sp.]|nr:hypothetical protein [Sorangium sp.]
GATPRLGRNLQGRYAVALYSDLKRHIMGPNLRDSRRQHGVSAAQFQTPPLWGLARSGPYLHDGRAATIQIAIMEHSGEASEVRDRYAALSDDERAPLRIFLTSLTRAPRMIVPRY